MRASNFASDESLGHQHMGVVMARELDYFITHIRFREPGKLKDKAEGTQLLKIQASVKMKVDLEEYHNATEADLLIAKKGMQMQGNR
ncbi:hypothetical protein BHE74_00059529 [Ensete ventricosum]|nr:hypothetical protein BHE74_00059529 [Ensete ventricosum]